MFCVFCIICSYQRAMLRPPVKLLPLQWNQLLQHHRQIIPWHLQSQLLQRRPKMSTMGHLRNQIVRYCLIYVFKALLRPCHDLLTLKAGHLSHAMSLHSIKLLLTCALLVSLLKLIQIIMHYWDNLALLHRATRTMAITLSVLDQFAKFFHCCKEQ